jgi:hypothetical protein
MATGTGKAVEKYFVFLLLFGDPQEKGFEIWRNQLKTSTVLAMF